MLTFLGRMEAAIIDCMFRVFLRELFAINFNSKYINDFSMDQCTFDHHSMFSVAFFGWIFFLVKIAATSGRKSSQNSAAAEHKFWVSFSDIIIATITVFSLCLGNMWGWDEIKYSRGEWSEADSDAATTLRWGRESANNKADLIIRSAT